MIQEKKQVSNVYLSHLMSGSGICQSYCWSKMGLLMLLYTSGELAKAIQRYVAKQLCAQRIVVWSPSTGQAKR